MRAVNIVVEKKMYESFESMLARFRRLVDGEGVLKDYKLNAMILKKDRKKFKEFASARRVKKKEKRILSAKCA